jgi:hypothetical protein
METSQDALSRPAPDRRDRSIEARLRARRKKGARERHIIDLLNRGVSLAEIAASRGVTLRRMQILVKTILARRAPAAPAEYLALQISRLNEAMYVAIGEMKKGDLRAVDWVMRLVSEMDRYHGFFPNGEDKRIVPDRLASPQPPLALEAPAMTGAMETAPQAFENARFGDGNGETGPRPGGDPANGGDGAPNGAASG